VDTHEAVSAAVKKAIDKIYGNIDVSLIFGMDGRNLEQVKNAIEVGYRNFDCAQSYGNTGILAQAIKDSGADRGEFKVCYKFDVANGESAGSLEGRLLGVAAQFGGRLDDVMIHNLDAPQPAIENAWRVLNKMKGDGKAAKVGVGNVGVKDGDLMSTLGGIGKIDVVENSISSLLSSPAIAEMIRKSGAEVYVYDVIKTAKEIGINTEAGIKALIATVAGEHASSTAIMSSSDAHRASRNIRKFGDGSKLQDIDYKNKAEVDAFTEVNTWRNKQSCEANDEGFALPGPVAAWADGLMGDAGEAMRERIEEAATTDEKELNAEFIQTWLNANGGPTRAQQLLTVPARTGLKKRYLGMPLGNVVAALFGSSSCDWKWSWQLVQLMKSSADDWEGFLKFGADEIVAE
jgi:diketogulonate reductase-like aldo/keto reductase